MLTSPFTPGELPRVLVGRHAELERVRGRLARTATYGEFAGTPLVLHAPRGLGKTSLLRAAEEEARALGFVTAWLSCVKGQPALADLVSAVEGALAATDSLTSRARRGWDVVVEKVSVEIGLPGVKLGADVSPGERAAGATGPVAAVERLLHEASRMVRENGGAGLVLLVDELHAMAYGQLGVLLNAVQNLAGHRADNPIVVLGAGLPSTPETIMRAATFGERCEFVGLDRFDAQDSRRVLVEPAEALDVSWTGPGLETALEVADGYPYLLQLVGDATWTAAAPVAGTALGKPDVRAGRERMAGQLAAMSRARWESAAPLEQAFMDAMAAYPEEVVPRQFVADTLGRDSRAISVPRARLIDRGVIEAAGRGMLRFTLPGMRAWLLARESD